MLCQTHLTVPSQEAQPPGPRWRSPQPAEKAPAYARERSALLLLWPLASVPSEEKGA